MLLRSIAMIICLFCCAMVFAQQTDTSAARGNTPAASLPEKYLTTISSKADLYYSGLTGKTEKTLEKLARWEGKIKSILEKTSPETAQRLFGNGQLTFAALLEKYKQGKAAADDYRGKYDAYRDKVTTSLKYLDDKYNKYIGYISNTGDTVQGLRFNGLRFDRDSSKQSSVSKLSLAREQTVRLNEQVRQTEAVEQFIKERKKELMEQAVKYLSNNKYIKKISKESYYYVQTIANYKELFSDPKKAEELALKLLQKLPGFDDFMRRNSMLASLFNLPQNSSQGGNVASLAGLQTRAQVSGLIQQQLSAGGPNAMQQFQQNMQAAQAQLNELKKRLNPDLPQTPSEGGGFRPNNQKSKTFLQRLEYSANVQSQKATAYFPVTSDLGLSVGYKLNDKSVIGVGASYKLGWGSGWNNIRISHQGMGIRSFMDWKLKGSFWMSGGYERNYRPTSPLPPLQGERGKEWRSSGLIGLSKVVSVKSKFFKKTKVQLLWDFLSYEQVPRTQAVVFRLGYGF
ncbi:MAG: hypothetical protein JNM88_18275 [Chitinophagaceae bacterium]|nr:hypothetical protein [Chitinophagaceae bacterium]